MSNQPERTPAVIIELDGYDQESREYGDCGKAALIPIGQLAGMSVCNLEFGHGGVHDWDPGFEYDDEPDEEDSE